MLIVTFLRPWVLASVEVLASVVVLALKEIVLVLLQLVLTTTLTEGLVSRWTATKMAFAVALSELVIHWVHRGFIHRFAYS